MSLSTHALVALMAVQALFGLVWPSEYGDPEWIKATWFGNDWVTLLIAAPLMWASHRTALGGSVRAKLVWLGTVGYAVYNYAFYLFGSALNVFLPLYVITCGIAMVTLASGLATIDPIGVERRISAAPHMRLVSGYLMAVACGLSLIWIAMWAAYVFGGRPTPVEPEAFKIVAALDLLWLAPSLAAGGALLWRRRRWGWVIGPAACVQSLIYLLVLSVNSLVAVRRGLVASPGELPIWGPLTVLTGVATLLLLRGSQPLERDTPEHTL